MGVDGRERRRTLWVVVVVVVVDCEEEEEEDGVDSDDGMEGAGEFRRRSIGKAVVMDLLV